MSIIGIDVSHLNGPVDWQAAAESISFGFAKASQGTGFADPYFHANWKSMKQAGVPRGAYHFFEPSKDAVAQARLFLRTARLEDSDLPPVLHVDSVAGATVSFLLEGVSRWLQTVKTVTRKTPVLRTSAAFWQQIGWPEIPGNCPLWITQHNVSAPQTPGPGGGWAFWQFTQVGRCSGAIGHVELNRFDGSLEDLAVLSLPGSNHAKLQLAA